MYLAMYEEHKEIKLRKFSWVLDRLSERSTWLGLIGSLTGLGVVVQPQVAITIAGAGAFLAGLIAAATKDKTVVVAPVVLKDKSL